VIYLATAQVFDTEMQERIEHHQHRRPSDWATQECPLTIGEAILRLSQPDNLILLDCMTLWLSNLLFCEQRDYPEVGKIHPPAAFTEQRAALFHALETLPGSILLVSNEVGMGIIPQGAISRWFVDEAGRLNQSLAQICEQVTWVAAGLPLHLKSAEQVPTV